MVISLNPFRFFAIAYFVLHKKEKWKGAITEQDYFSRKEEYDIDARNISLDIKREVERKRSFPMAVNMDKPQLWKEEIARSVDFYNEWFMLFAPKAYRETRSETTEKVKAALFLTNNLQDISTIKLKTHPEILPILRMSTAPPIARDRLIGLASVPGNLVRSIEIRERLPLKMSSSMVTSELEKICDLIGKLIDRDIFPWLENAHQPSKMDVYRAATVVADRLCGALADPIIRNAQEKRQLASIRAWLEAKNYKFVSPLNIADFREMKPLTFSFHLNIPVFLERGETKINIPIDVVIMREKSKENDLPLLIECKSAGDYTNTNKRRKEEAIKNAQLRSNYGDKICFILFLCGYFDSGYLGYEAAEGFDWIWEHRIDDLSMFGV